MPVDIVLNPHVRGDQWAGIGSIGPVTVDGAAPAEALARVKMHFRKVGDNSKALGYGFDSTVTSGFGVIVIGNAATWAVSVPEQALPLAEGKWNWDMEFYRTGVTLPWTLFRGVLEVLEDFTFNG